MWNTHYGLDNVVRSICVKNEPLQRRVTVSFGFVCMALVCVGVAMCGQRANAWLSSSTPRDYSGELGLQGHGRNSGLLRSLPSLVCRFRPLYTAKNIMQSSSVELKPVAILKTIWAVVQFDKLLARMCCNNALTGSINYRCLEVLEHVLQLQPFDPRNVWFILYLFILNRIWNNPKEDSVTSCFWVMYTVLFIYFIVVKILANF